MNQLKKRKKNLMIVFLFYNIYIYIINMLSEPITIILITSIMSVFLKLISLCYKSKCKTFQCWGIKIERDVFIEEEYDERELNQIKKTNSTVI